MLGLQPQFVAPVRLVVEWLVWFVRKGEDLTFCCCKWVGRVVMGSSMVMGSRGQMNWIVLVRMKVDPIYPWRMQVGIDPKSAVGMGTWERI